MSGRRLVDAARLAAAARNVARQHIALRSEQLDAYSRTSTLAKAAKGQTDRVTLTVKAAIALAERLGGDAARYDPYAKAGDQDPVDVKGSRKYENEPHKKGEDVIYASAGDSMARPTGPRVETQDAIPSHIATESRTSADIKASGLNSDISTTSNNIPSQVADEVPPGVDINVFRTKKVARMLHPDAQSASPPHSIPIIDTIPETAPEKTLSSPQAVSTPAAKAQEKTPYQMRESRVPSTRIGRLWQYGNLGMSMAFGAVGETFRRATGGGSEGTSILLSPGNLEILVARLSRMRGAALKLGQMISFQDLKLLPPPIHQVLQRVQDSADYMPPSQRDQVLSSNLGADWRDLFSSFEEVPVAAASIGQVHKAVLKSTGATVAVKVQYPGVAKSIDSDLNNLSILLTASKLLPKGLFLDKTIANARTELAWECDYEREAECAIRFHELLADDTKVFTVPKVIKEASGKQVLTAEFMDGIGVTKMPELSQSERDWIGTHILRLCLREITEFKFMQTDPNWTNFLFNAEQQKLELLDFGASRDYPDEFIKPYVGVLKAAAIDDRKTVKDLSIELGYLTGKESRAMANAHIDSVLTLAEPFSEASPEVYDFRDQTITDRVRGLIPMMLKERLAPPPEETYSLHRKLSGAFLLCARLGSRVRCRELFAQAMEKGEY